MIHLSKLNWYIPSTKIVYWNLTNFPTNVLFLSLEPAQDIMLHVVYMSPASSNAGDFWPFLTMTHCGQCSGECPSMWVCLMFCHEVMDSFGILPEVMCPCFIRGHMILIWLITGDVNINYLVKVEFATVLHYKGVFVCLFFTFSTC